MIIQAENEYKINMRVHTVPCDNFDKVTLQMELNARNLTEQITAEREDLIFTVSQRILEDAFDYEDYIFFNRQNIIQAFSEWLERHKNKVYTEQKNGEKNGE